MRVFDILDGLTEDVATVVDKTSPNTYFWWKTTSGSTITTTSSVSLNTTNFTTKTGKFLVMGDAAVYTSRYTSGIHIKVNGTTLTYQMTNQTALHHLTVMGIYEGTKDTTYEVGLFLQSQDTGTTGTVAAYTNIHFIIIDIPQGGVIRTAFPVHLERRWAA